MHDFVIGCIMSSWDSYVDKNTSGGKHLRYKEWSVSGVWEFTRRDGLKTAHKMESPFATWLETVEESMRLADSTIPLGADIPASMRSKYDPLYDWSSR